MFCSIKKRECLTRRIYYFVLTRAWNFPNEYEHQSREISGAIYSLRV